MFHDVELCLLLFRVQLLKCFVGLIVEDDQVAVAHVEPRKMVARFLRVENVLVDHEGRAASLGSVPTEKKRFEE